eukprot:GGOE01000727.1.p2 GENE.GGOE01000727.1~~GGOE01000727.1.p2  ORF type:complete len:122 (+),score=11.41 GGOE01000727.1:45-368(+)
MSAEAVRHRAWLEAQQKRKADRAARMAQRAAVQPPHRADPSPVPAAAPPACDEAGDGEASPPEPKRRRRETSVDPEEREPTGIAPGGVTLIRVPGYTETVVELWVED